MTPSIRTGNRVGVETVAYDLAAGPAGPVRVGQDDSVASEEPLEIRLVTMAGAEPLATTMRTPGNDFELASGWLFAEGVVDTPGAIATISYCIDRSLDQAQRYNIVNVKLRGDAAPDVRGLARHFVVSSACGVCGRASLESLRERGIEPVTASAPVAPSVLVTLPATMREAQAGFARTGGLHAAALFDRTGSLLSLREDVGRHNALDKLVGAEFLAGHLPLHDRVLLVSGRSSYELVQKAAAAGIPVVCSVSAPSSLAVATAEEFGITLVGFLRGSRFNVYTNADVIL
ncbi:MAG: formate dehydrogenase accessory sulfurtransferase FdhD [Candidatus Dormibacteria bacterium]